MSLPPSEPFLFLDSDIILTGRIEPRHFDFVRPGLTPAMPNWPIPKRSNCTIAEIWESLYRYFDLDPSGYFDRSLGANTHQCYPYYQGNVIYSANAGRFGSLMLDMAKRLWAEQPEPVRRQKLTPWLDQIVLPLVLAGLGIARKAQPDPCREIIMHYQYPLFLAVRNVEAMKCFEELRKDPVLESVLQHDEGFRYYMSAEGKEFAAKMYSEFLKSPMRGKKGAFKELMREKAPILR